MQPQLYSPETKLLAEKICNGSSNDLSSLFEKRTEKWPHHIIYCETFSIGSFDDLLQKLSPKRAFQLIPNALEIVSKKNVDLLITALALLTQLAAATKTTELPPILVKKLPELRTQIKAIPNNPDLQLYWYDFIKWYRLQP